MRVVVISNDLVPEQGTPVAAPGVRAHQLASGLRAHGVDAEIVVAGDAVEAYRASGAGPEPLDTVAVVAPEQLQRHIRGRRADVAVMINGNQAQHLEWSTKVRFVLDVFAPRVLEMAYRDSGAYPVRGIARLREQTLAAYRLAEAVIVNGARKKPYATAWLLQTDRDVRDIPIRVVEMGIPIGEVPVIDRSGPLRIGITGYVQRWSAPGDWLDAVAEHLGEGVIAEAILGTHWGKGAPLPANPALDRFMAHPRVLDHPPMAWDDYLEHLAGLDLVIDVFERTAERELAMVTRTAVALGAGVPVVHPPFTETAELIRASGAGWLIETDGLGALLGDLVTSRDGLEPARVAAARLARERLDASVSVLPLVELLG